jgi:hypothetical protein
MKTLEVIFSGIPLLWSGQFMAASPADRQAVYQIIISEIMADPNPIVKLPDTEYIELFNRGDCSVKLDGWKLAFGSREKTLPAFTLAPGDFLIVCDSDREKDLEPYGQTLPVPNMPAIVNTGQTLVLKSDSGQIIHAVAFSADWYDSRTKAEGGWSLEMIDPGNPCGYADNWRGSIDPRGGTPGMINSVRACNPDMVPPQILRATLPNDSSVMLLFSESMDSASVYSCGLYSANGGLLHPSLVDPRGPDYAQVLLHYRNRFQTDKRYTLTIRNTLKDCTGNTISGKMYTDFAVPETPSRCDLIINEVLFNPESGKSEFIELFNRSAKVLNLADFSIARADISTGESLYVTSLLNNPFLIFPGCYVVLTSDAVNLPGNCYLYDPSVIAEQVNLFMLPNDEGIIVLSDYLDQTIDEFHYSNSMHAGLLTTTAGISLERVDSELPASSWVNWCSASAASGYSTPGRQNSQALTLGQPGEEVILQPEVFSPDNDGMDDYVTLRLKLPEPGWMATIRIFDRNGKKIRDLASNCLLGTEESFTWDGTSNDQQPAAIGLFVICAELFNQHGGVKNFMKVVTLARRF